MADEYEYYEQNDEATTGEIIDLIISHMRDKGHILNPGDVMSLHESIDDIIDRECKAAADYIIAQIPPAG